MTDTTRPSREQIAALLRWLADEGHVTPVATRQILSLWETDR